MHTMQAAAVILNMPFILVTFVALACALVSAIHDHDFVGAVFVAALAIVLLVVADVLILRNCIITPALRPASESNVDFIESPYSGDIDWNLRYLAICGIDTMNRGRMPTSSHGSMTIHPACLHLFVKDDDEKWTVFGRDECIARANDLRRLCAKTVFYVDRGMSRGMKAALQYCKKNNLPYEKRRVDVEALANLNAPKLPREFIKSVCSADSVESATHYQHIERSD